MFKELALVVGGREIGNVAEERCCLLRNCVGLKFNLQDSAHVQTNSLIQPDMHNTHNNLMRVTSSTK